LARDVLEALSATVYLTDAAGRLTFYNRAAAVLWGRCPKPGGAQWCGSWRLYWPDGTPLPHDQCPMAVAVKQNRQVRGAEALAERPDGARVPFAPHPTPLRDPDGELTGAVNLLVDTTEHRSGEAARRGRRYARLWRKEAEHHANNLLMAILPIAARIGEEAVQPRRQPQGRARALALRIMDENGLGSEPTGSRYSGRGSRPRASRADCGLWGP
jgi:PAS domain-containing protein